VVVIAVSDVHLGCLESNNSKFKSFLDYAEAIENLKDFVIVGDFVDMWRRDASGLFLENHEILQSLMRMKSKKVNVHYVVGNHDYHLLKLKEHNYSLNFQEMVPLSVDGVNYEFRHGYEFDWQQKKLACELLCHNFSDTAGKFRSEFWKWITGKPDLLKELSGAPSKGEGVMRSSFNSESLTLEDLVSLMKPPYERAGCKETSPIKGIAGLGKSVEEIAAASVERDKVLVFGHTHRPFANVDGRLFNTGSWMSNEETVNTYIIIDGKHVSLIQFDGHEGKDITKIKTKSYKVANRLIS
jgi:UDP-2,3-diacylglucosamine pyrophosphatase LpxH